MNDTVVFADLAIGEYFCLMYVQHHIGVKFSNEQYYLLSSQWARNNIGKLMECLTPSGLLTRLDKERALEDAVKYLSQQGIIAHAVWKDIPERYTTLGNEMNTKHIIFVNDTALLPYMREAFDWYADATLILRPHNPEESKHLHQYMHSLTNTSVIVYVAGTEESVDNLPLPLRHKAESITCYPSMKVLKERKTVEPFTFEALAEGEYFALEITPVHIGVKINATEYYVLSGLHDRPGKKNYLSFASHIRPLSRVDALRQARARLHVQGIDWRSTWGNIPSKYIVE